jgi:hypothetical protein
MASYVESTLLRRDVAGDERYRHVDVEQDAALQAVHVIVSFNPAVVAAGLVGERQLLDQPVLSQQMERAIDRSVADVWVAAPHTLKDLSGGQMRLRLADLLEDRRALRRVLESLSWHN